MHMGMHQTCACRYLHVHVHVDHMYVHVGTMGHMWHVQSVHVHVPLTLLMLSAM